MLKVLEDYFSKREDIAFAFLVYDINSLKRIPSWQTLNLLKDAHFVLDKKEVKEIFKKILKEAEEYAIVYDNEENAPLLCSGVTF